MQTSYSFVLPLLLALVLKPQVRRVCFRDQAQRRRNTVQPIVFAMFCIEMNGIQMDFVSFFSTVR